MGELWNGMTDIVTKSVTMDHISVCCHLIFRCLFGNLEASLA